MVNNSAIVSVVKRITENNGSSPCKKTLQKIVFLIEAKNIDLGCDYGIHFYGPYSADLDFAVRELSNEGVLDIEYTSTEHRISVIEDYNDMHTDKELSGRINAVVDEFSRYTASELELIATALYVYLQKRSTDEIVLDVQKIKGEKYSVSKIQEAIQTLKEAQYIVA